MEVPKIQSEQPLKDQQIFEPPGQIYNNNEVLPKNTTHQQTTQYPERLSRSIRLAKMQALLLNQQHQYSEYFTSNGNSNFHPPYNPDESSDQSEEQGDNKDEQFDLADYISSLPLRLKQQFKQSNPQLPQIFFMSKQEKKKYFQDLNNKFKNSLSQAPQRKSLNKKRLKFKNEFEIRGFNEKQKVVNIKQAKEFKEAYSNDIHFS